MQELLTLITSLLAGVEGGVIGGVRAGEADAVGAAGAKDAGDGAV